MSDVSAGMTMYDARAKDALTALGIADADDAVRCELGEIVTAGRQGWTRRIETPVGTLYLKCHRWRRLMSRLRFTLARDTARREFDNLVLMEKLEIPAARPLAVGTSRNLLGMPRASFLLLVGLEDTRDLETALPELAAATTDPKERARRRRALALLGGRLGRLHEAGYVDGDMHFRNILLRDAGVDYELFFIDSPKGRVLSASTARNRARIHDLACLDKHADKWLSRCDRLRVLRGYLGRRLKAGDRELIDAVLERAAHLMRKRERKLAEDAKETG